MVNIALGDLEMDACAEADGNRDGTLWLDARPVRYQAVRGKPVVYSRDGERWVSASLPLVSTPWLYAVELPERVVLAPVRDLWVPFAITGGLIALAGALLGIQFSRRITGPLAERLTAAGAAFVGIDSLNIDDMAGGERPVHSTLLANDIPIGEHLTGLEALPERGGRFFAVPVKVRAFGTFPVRAFAIV